MFILFFIADSGGETYPSDFLQRNTHTIVIKIRFGFIRRDDLPNKNGLLQETVCFPAPAQRA